MDQDNESMVFKRSFRGYSVAEVDEYVDSAKKDIEALKSELSDLYAKYSEARAEADKYRREEEVRGDIIRKAKADADEILGDAKTRAARVIIRTSRQCNRIVADMVAQVEEQKNIYDAAKKEVLKFRGDIFSLYREHVKKINAYAEAAGAFETDALSQSEIDGFMKLLGDDYNSDLEDASLAIGEMAEEAESEISGEASEFPVRAEEPAPAEPAPTETAPAETAQDEDAAESENDAEPAEEPFDFHGMPGLDDDPSPEELGLVRGATKEITDEDTPVVPEEDASFDPDEFEFNDVSPKEPKEQELEFGSESEDGGESEDPDVFSLSEEDSDEFGEEGVVENAVDEFDGPVSLNDVFGSLSSYSDADFESVYGDADEEETEKVPVMTEEELMERRRRADDDSNEFYTEEDIEFDPFAGVELPTSRVESIADGGEMPPSRKKRWKIKRSMSITDEFKAVKSDEDD